MNFFIVNKMLHIICFVLFFSASHIAADPKVTTAQTPSIPDVLKETTSGSEGTVITHHTTSPVSQSTNQTTTQGPVTDTTNTISTQIVTTQTTVAPSTNQTTAPVTTNQTTPVTTNQTTTATTTNITTIATTTTTNTTTSTTTNITTATATTPSTSHETTVTTSAHNASTVIPPTTPTPSDKTCHGFDGWSFVGGIILGVLLCLGVFFGIKLYNNRRSLNLPYRPF